MAFFKTQSPMNLQQPACSSPFLPENESAYQAWRTDKLKNYPTTIDAITIDLNALDDFCVQQRQAIFDLCAKTNLVIYRVAKQPDKEAISDFAFLLGLHRFDANLCADNDSISSICVHADSDLHKQYIPYSNKALSWHTDGYYNKPDQLINAFLMHCAQPAQSGGLNQFLDPEILYILLRDDNPDSIAALFETDVMTIPKNSQNGKDIRAAQSGPVFSIDSGSHSLHMRYTARKRNIEWKQDSRVLYAVRKIEEILLSNIEYSFNYTPVVGQGVLANNVLHNRSEFIDQAGTGKGRLIYRARFYDRISVGSQLE